MNWKVIALVGALAVGGCALNPAKLLKPDPEKKAAAAQKKAEKVGQKADKAQLKADQAAAKAVKAKAAVAKPERKEQEAAFWLADGQQILARAQQRITTRAHAKNVILFIGDGMGISTVTAARILATQTQDEKTKAKGTMGEEGELAFERFPGTALAKTYNTDLQTAEAAGAMSAIMTGVKTRGASVAVGPKYTRGQCQDVSAVETPTLMEQAKATGLATGLVTTARVTFAVPAATYAHVSDRDWEVDAVMPAAAREQQCRDIAYQLAVSRGALDVVLGGGRLAFLPRDAADPVDKTRLSARLGSEDLIALWLRNNGGQYITTGSALKNINWDLYKGPLLGLFAPDHMAFEADRTGLDQPSLTEMTTQAIKALRRNSRGYILVVDASGIDRAHHEANARRALTETVELSHAVQAAMDMTNAGDTLIMVTAEHSHTLTIGGYPRRGNPILGVVVGPDGQPQPDAGGRPYTTLAYAEGPVLAAGRPPVTDAEAQGLDYRQGAAVPLSAATHGGEDTPVYASGPGSQWVHGTLDQHALYQVIRTALLGPQKPKPNKIAGFLPKPPNILPFGKKKDDQD